MEEFIRLNAINILIIIVSIVTLAYLYKIGKKGIVYRVLLFLVVEAELLLGSGTGDLKYAYVISKVYDKLPTLIRVLFTQKEINSYIEIAVAKLKELLESGVTLEGYLEEKSKEV